MRSSQERQVGEDGADRPPGVERAGEVAVRSGGRRGRAGARARGCFGHVRTIHVGLDALDGRRIYPNRVPAATGSRAPLDKPRSMGE
jgi:hypothetical protein